MISRRNFLAALMLSAFVADVAYANRKGAKSKFEEFFEKTTSASGKFKQTVIDKSGRESALPSAGRFRFLRPGCFEWTYETPYEQRIQSDGVTLWLYDPDLMQVTVKRLDETLPTTPASILFGERAFGENWTVTELSQEKLEVIPNDRESGFEKLFITMTENSELKGLELIDNFGQKTTLEFFDIRRDKNTLESFRFEIPEGADVLRDEGV